MSEIDLPWTIVECDEAQVDRLAAEAGVPRIVARLLINRGVTIAADAARFLSPSMSDLHDPSLLPDFEPAVERLALALRRNEKIWVHGDYDVDGITSTALLVRALGALKADVDYCLPVRQKDGYDIKRHSVETAAKAGVGLIVTCDCGTSAYEAISRANELGIAVIVTDHHQPGAELAPACAVVNPKRSDACYPFPDLAGVGVAYKFMQGLVRKLDLSEESFLNRFLDLAALGTVGDVVPLLGENRAIVKHGLEAIPRSRKIGLQTMLRSTGLEGKPMTAYYLGYILGPRINAAGRMGDASTALRLLLTKSEQEATSLAGLMDRHNAERRAEQERILSEAQEQIETKDLDRARVLVLSRQGWNSGVVGIVAGKICDLYSRPTVVVSRDEARGIGHGSARSIPAFDLIAGLTRCSDLLQRYGGHALAAGVTVSLQNLEALEQRLSEIALEIVPPEELVPRIEVEAELEPSQITRELAETLAMMEPYGNANPEPLFVTRNLAVVSRERVGDGSHLKLLVQAEGCPAFSCIAFGMGDAADRIAPGATADICHSIRMNSYNGNESLQLVAKAIR